MNKLKSKLAPMLNDINDDRKNDVWRILLFGLNKATATTATLLIGRWAYYTQNVLLLGVFLAGVILPMTILDAVTDPIIANWFDKFKSKYGKIRPMMVIGGIMSIVPGFVIFTYPVNPPNIPIGVTYAILTIMYALLVIGFSILQTTTRAGQAIITQAPEQRPVFALGVTVFDGILMGLFALTLDSDLLGSIQDPFVWRFNIILFSVLSVFFIAISAWAVSTRDNEKYYSYNKQKEKGNIFEFLRVAKRNNALKRLLWAQCSDAFAASVRNLLSIYLFANIIMQRSLIAPVNIINGIVLGFPFIMIGVYLASQKGSAKIYTNISLIQLTMALIGFFTVLIIMPADPDYTYSGFTIGVLIVCLFYGIYINTLGVSSNLIVAMTGDLADYEYSKSGKFIPGTIGATLTFFQKLFNSIAGLAIIGIMVFSGFTGIGEEAVVPENVFVNYRFYYAVLVSVFIFPAIGHLITYIAMKDYPITAEMSNKISLEMEKERKENYS